MKQGDLLIPNQFLSGMHVIWGTLGGFVTKLSDMESKYAVTCSHLFLNERKAAYVSATPQPKQIRKCVFEIERDFAIIENDKSVSRVRHNFQKRWQ